MCTASCDLVSCEPIDAVDDDVAAVRGAVPAADAIVPAPPPALDAAYPVLSARAKKADFHLRCVI